MNVNQMPKRANVHYTYAAGLAIRNSPGPMKISEMYDFIKVFMPAICTWKNDNWENCLRSYVSSTKEDALFEKIATREENSGRDDCTYTFKAGKEADWERKYPINKYDPQMYLEVPGEHEALYYGRIGPIDARRLEAARVGYLTDRAPWREPKKPRKPTKAQERRAREREEMESQRLEMQFQAEMERRRQEELNNAVRGLEEFGDEGQEEHDFAPQSYQNLNPQIYQDQFEDQSGVLEYIPEEENEDPMPQLEPEVYNTPYVQSHRRFAAALQNCQQQRQQTIQHHQRKQNLQRQVTPGIPKPHEPSRMSPYDIVNRQGSSKQVLGQPVHGLQRTAAPLPLQNRQQQIQEQYVVDETEYDVFNRQGTSNEELNEPVRSVRPPSTPSPLQLRQQQRQEYSKYRVSYSDDPQEVLGKKMYRIQSVQVKQTPQQNGYKPRGQMVSDIPPHRLLAQRKRILPETPQQAPVNKQIPSHRLLRESQVVLPQPPPPAHNQANYANNDDYERYHNMEPVAPQVPPIPAAVQANYAKNDDYERYHNMEPVAPQVPPTPAAVQANNDNYYDGNDFWNSDTAYVDVPSTSSSLEEIIDQLEYHNMNNLQCTLRDMPQPEEFAKYLM